MCGRVRVIGLRLVRPPPKKAALRLSDNILSGLLLSVQLPHGSDVTRRFLRRASAVGIVADGLDGAGWANELQGSHCRPKIVTGKEGDAILEHVEIQAGSVGKVNNIVVNCSSTDNSIDCEDNMGGSSSVYCDGADCSGTSTSGFDTNVDARPDIRITAPKFAWVFIDPQTGEPIGTWSIRRNSLDAVRAILGCEK